LAFGTALVGFSFAKAYGHSVPHFYAGNIHHSMGWFLFLILWGQVLVGVVRKIANAVARSRSDAHYDRLETVHLVGRAESSSSSSSDSHHQRSQNSEDTLNDDEDFQYDKDNIVMSPVELEDPEFPSSYDEPEEKPTIVMRAFNVVSPFIPSFIKKVFVVTAHNPFTVTICRWAHLITGRVFPLLIFIQTLSGMVVYAGVCRYEFTYFFIFRKCSQKKKTNDKFRPIHGSKLNRNSIFFCTPLTHCSISQRLGSSRLHCSFD
jgi:hypothetical protein